jgi:protein-disulfide isomerase
MRRCLLALTALATCLAAAQRFDPGKVLGNADAPVVIEVYSSFDCPHCKIFHDEIEPSLMKDYIAAGKVALVNREFPLTGQYHPYAREAAILATAAARIGKYPEVADALWKNQATWANNGRVWETVASVLTLPDQKKVQALARDPGVQAEVQQDLDEGLKRGINSTPTVFLDAKGKSLPLPPGVPAYNLLVALINDSLK